MKRLHPEDFDTWQDYYRTYQFNLADEYYLPWLFTTPVRVKGKQILDIGCGNGGFTEAFARRGAWCTGVENRPVKWKSDSPNLRFIQTDITSSDAPDILGGPYDLVILRDVIEHIPGVEKIRFMKSIRNLIKDDARLLVTFPPFYSPFGLHQQTFLKSHVRKIPFLGWVPMFVLIPLLKYAGEDEKSQKNIREIRNCKMTVGGFLRLLKDTGYEIEKETYFHIRPSHEIRYGWKTCESSFGHIPILREFVNMGAAFILKQR